jgi:hypothetical protein
MEIGTIISIGAVVISLTTLILNRRDKVIADTKESNLGLINFRLDQLDKNVQRILSKLETYDKELDERIDKKIHEHVETYHKRGRKTE